MERSILTDETYKVRPASANPLAFPHNAEGASFRARASTSDNSRRTSLLLMVLFWAYVTATNILWGKSLDATLTSHGITQIFAEWNSRLVQHLLLFPALWAAMRLSQRIGWHPPVHTIPLQLMTAIAFSALGNPAMDIALASVGTIHWHDLGFPGLYMNGEHYARSQLFMWAASVVMFLINYAFGLALFTGFDFYRRYRDAQLRAEALERSLGAAHLAALRMQLSPHTLFNLLHTIRGNVKWDPEVAQAMIVQLGDLLRRALQAGEHELSRLQDELEFVQLYFRLQQHRFGDRLQCTVPDLNSLPSVWVPSLILQPLVENAVVHGLAQPQRHVIVRVEVIAEGESLILRVINSMPSIKVVDESEYPGLGLRNVRERLAIQFNTCATCQSGLVTNNEWLAELRFPLLHNGA